MRAGRVVESRRQGSGTNTSAPTRERSCANMRQADKGEEEKDTERSGNHSGGEEVMGDRQIALILDEGLKEEGLMTQMLPVDEETAEVGVVGEKIGHIVNEGNGDVVKSSMLDETVRQCEDLEGESTVKVVRTGERRWKRRARLHNIIGEEREPILAVGGKRKEYAVEEAQRATKYARQGDERIEVGDENMETRNELVVAAAQHRRIL